MKRTLIRLAPATLFLGFFWLAPSAFATVPPTLSFSATGSGDNVLVTVTGDPNASVLLSYVQAGSGSQITSLGTTNASGSFSTTISSASYGLTSGTPVVALVGGTGGPKSPTVNWPTVTSSTAMTLAPAALVLNAGSSAMVNATNTGGNGLYVSNNSNPSIANVSISGTQITLYGNTAGSTNVTLCPVGTTGNCPTVFVLVESAGASQLSLSQNNVTVVSGQNLQITISGGNGSYALQSNSNPSTVQASLSGSVLTLSTGATTGSASLVLCSTDMGACGVVTATVGNSSSVSVSFSNTTPVVSTGQTTNINIYGPSGVSFYVSSNSNPSVVQANLSGTTLTLAGIASGSSTVNVCASTGTCSSLTVTVNTAQTGANIALSQNTLTLQVGQNSTIVISGGTTPYSISGGNTNVAQTSISGTSLTVYGIGGGTSSMFVCSAAGGCITLTVTVNGTPAATTTTTPTTTTTTTVPTTTTTAPAYTFTEYLSPGSQDNEVLVLQKLLASLGYLSATPNGYFGKGTKAAVIAFQAAHNIAQLGIVGPSTRTALNQAESNASTGSTSSIQNMTLVQLKAEAATLEAQLTQILNRISQLGG